MSYKLDKLDLNIIDCLHRNGRVSVTELAEEIGASRPTVINRLKRLQSEELVIIKGGLNIRKIGFKIACVGLEIKTDERRFNLQELLKSCPRVLSAFRVAEKANLVVHLWGENETTLRSTIESYHDFADFELVYVHLLGTPTHGDTMINLSQGREGKTPCGKRCSDCERYKNLLCLGCPAVSEYRTPF